MHNLPQPSETEIQQLLALFDQAQYYDAELRARKLVEAFPDYGFAWKVLAVALRQQGKITAALAPMQKAVELLPNDAEAHSNLGVMLMNQGLLADAVLSYRRALKLNSDYIDVYHYLGLTLITLGELAEAEHCYQQLLALNPDYPDAYYHLGRIFQAQAQFAEAEACYRRVLETHADLADIHNNLAWVLHQQGNFQEAENYYQQAIKLNPQDVKAYSNLGVLLQNQGRLDEALDCYQCALEINPDFAEIYNNMGIVFHRLGSTFEAEACYQKALALHPDHDEVYNNLGLNLQIEGRLDKAEKAYRHALTINPNNAQTYNNLGILFQQRGQLIEAQASYQRSLTIQPNNAQTHNNLGTVYQGLGQTLQAETNFRNALMLKPDYSEAHSNLLFVMNQCLTHSPTGYLAEAQQYELQVRQKANKPFNRWYFRDKNERLCIGIVSGDLCQQDIGLFLAELLPLLDYKSFKFIAYSTCAKSDQLTEQIRPYFTAWKPLVGLSDRVAARMIHTDGVDILLDLSGHRNHNRLPLFAWKPAPKQVTWLGSLASTGMHDIQYILGDPYVTPLAQSAQFSETIWQLPEIYRCFILPKVDIKVNELPALSNDFITFASFNALSHLNEPSVALWATLLHALPKARLLLKDALLADNTICQTTLQRFATQGILPERLLLESLGSLEEQLLAYQRVDIALDNCPHSTYMLPNALWMGVPVLAQAGDRFITRHADTILHNAGLSEWLADNDTDYVNKAIYFAENREKLAELRTQLREQVLASALYDMKGFAQQFEAALWSMGQA